MLKRLHRFLQFIVNVYKLYFQSQFLMQLPILLAELEWLFFCFIMLYCLNLNFIFESNTCSLQRPAVICRCIYNSEMFQRSSTLHMGTVTSLLDDKSFVSKCPASALHQLRYYILFTVSIVRLLACYSLLCAYVRQISVVRPLTPCVHLRTNL